MSFPLKGIVRRLRSLNYLAAFLLAPLFIMSTKVVVPLFYEMTMPPGGNGTMDSIAIWVGTDPNESIVFVTDKTGDVLEMHNPVTNTYTGRLGSSGSGPGELSYPNGPAVAYNVPTSEGNKDVLFVVERDNHRVSAFSLPDLTFIGYYGASDLEEPYGIGLYWNGSQLQTWITDVGPSNDRVYVYNVVPGGDGVTGDLDFYFLTGAALESIVIDPVSQHALICDEGAGQDVMVFDLSGNLLQRFGSGLFVNDPEGIALYDLGNGAGYIIVADQNATPTEFEVFDRETYDHIGYFTGPTEGTDGIALTQFALPNLPNGSFYAMHSDRQVHVYDWADIANALGLDINVISHTTSIDEKGDLAPENFRMLENYPNPFNPSTTIRYNVSHLAPVSLRIYNTIGEEVTTLVNEMQGVGEHKVQWDGCNSTGRKVASGMYVARLTVGNSAYTQKMILER